MIKAILGWVAAAVILTTGAVAAEPQKGSEMLVYIGTAVGPKSEGIYVCRMDPATGELSRPELAGRAGRPSYVEPHPSGRFLYAVNEVSDVNGKKGGAVTAFAIDRATGKLRELNSQSTGGAGPCYVMLDRAGRWALAANYGGGSVAVIRVNEDGTLGEQTAFVQHEGTGPNARRQAGPHAHCFDFDPSGQFVLACDLGTDEVRVYRFDNDAGTLAAAEPGRVKPGAGPRHVAFAKDGRFAYVINEMGCTVTAFAYDGSIGGMTEVQTVGTLPPDYPQTDKDTGSEIFVHPSGKWVYASNRGHDSIVCFDVDPATGQLSRPRWTPSGGKVPRYFGIDPSGRWMLVANQGSDNVVVYEIGDDGGLKDTGHQIEAGAPTCVKFVR